MKDTDIIAGQIFNCISESIHNPYETQYTAAEKVEILEALIKELQAEKSFIDLLYE